MDLATLLGLIITFGFILGAILAGGSILLFVNVPSLLIVIGGSVSFIKALMQLSSLNKPAFSPMLLVKKA